MRVWCVLICVVLDKEKGAGRGRGRYGVHAEIKKERKQLERLREQRTLPRKTEVHERLGLAV